MKEFCCHKFEQRSNSEDIFEDGGGWYVWMINEKVEINYCPFCSRHLKSLNVVCDPERILYKALVSRGYKALVSRAEQQSDDPCNPPPDILAERDREGIKAENEKQAERVRREYSETTRESLGQSCEQVTRASSTDLPSYREMRGILGNQSDANEYEHSYRVDWSEQDGEHVGLCAEFPSLSFLAATPEAALKGIQEVVAKTVEDLRQSGEQMPELRDE